MKPVIEVGHIETLSPTVGGYKGMGEGGAIVAPPADQITDMSTLG